MAERRFTRFRRAPVTAFPGASEVPDGGMCLSVFLLLEAPDRDGTVLLGQPDATAPWWEIGAIDAERLRRIGARWMLPSRQLRFYEGPDEAARAILHEQLGAGPLPLTGPQVFSDPADAPSPATADPHWDIHFVYRGRWPSANPPRSPVWKRLEFVGLAQLPRDDVARGQADVLELAGLASKG